MSATSPVPGLAADVRTRENVAPPARLANTLPRPAGELERLQAAWRAPEGWGWLKAVNNSQIGVLYIGTALLFFVLAGVLALLMRTQLAVPDNALVPPGLYNQLFTMHGTVMMFLFAVPIVEAVAVFILPAMLGARDLPFPRLSAYAFWAYAFGGIAFFVTIFFGASPDGGWFMYPPLTSAQHSPGIGADFWLLGIGFIEISAIAGAIELIVGILFTRAPGMTLSKMPVYAWAMLIVGFMIVFAFPAIIAGTALLELERAFDWPIFDAQRGGDPLIWQHLFWFFGHPEVYIIFLPAAGMVSMMVPVVARTPLAGERAIVVAIGAVGALSFLLWIHHMFTAGLGPLSVLLVSAASLAVAVPSGIQVFAWLATLTRGRIVWTTPALFIVGFVLLFTLGGLTGVMVAIYPFDVQAHDSYFIVAHLHYVLIGGMVFPLFGALYHWLPLVNGHRLSERLGRWVFWLMFGGFNLAFFPMHIVGLLGMPRRVYTYGAELGWSAYNLVSTIGAFVLAAGVLLFLFDFVRTLRRPKQEHGNPWDAPTLEWLPNGDYGARSIPQIDSCDPLWHRPALADEVEAGRHWLAGTVTGGRETLVTTPRAARIHHLMLVPGDSVWPIVAAAGTAAFFLLLTVKLTVAAFVGGVIAIVAILLWLWQTDRPPPQAFAKIGETVSVPIGAQGTGRAIWWATLVFVVVDATTLASMLFAHIHVAMAGEVCPPPGAALPSTAASLIATLMLLAGSGFVMFASARLRSRSGVVFSTAVVMALLLSVGGLSLYIAAFVDAGLQPRANAWSATAAALLGYAALHAVVLAMGGAYVLARAVARLLQRDNRASFDVVALLWHGTTVMLIVAFVVVHALPSL